MLESPMGKPGILIVFVLLSCLFAVESNKHIARHANRKTLPVKPFHPPQENAADHPPVQPDAAELERQEFLDAHNKIRLANNEPPLTWDPKLELFAKQYAEQHFEDCAMVHSPGFDYGENLCVGGAGKDWKISEIVTNSWYNEYQYYKAASDTCEEGHMCGHYTQLVWRDTERVGCVRMRCKNGAIYFICEYYPPGNVQTQKPFEDHHH